MYNNEDYIFLASGDAPTSRIVDYNSDINGNNYLDFRVLNVCILLIRLV